MKIDRRRVCAWPLLFGVRLLIRTMVRLLLVPRLRERTIVSGNSRNGRPQTLDSLKYWRKQFLFRLAILVSNSNVRVCKYNVVAAAVEPLSMNCAVCFDSSRCNYINEAQTVSPFHHHTHTQHTEHTCPHDGRPCAVYVVDVMTTICTMWAAYTMYSHFAAHTVEKESIVTHYSHYIGPWTLTDWHCIDVFLFLSFFFWMLFVVTTNVTECARGIVQRSIKYLSAIHLYIRIRRW